MELQNYISENSDYDKTLKEKGFIVKNFNKYNLKLIKYPYDRNVDTNTFERYLKGCIVDTKTNKVVMIPPIKSDNLINYNMCVNGAVIQELFDGTMINLFYHNDEWLHSTRSDINLNNKWTKKSFKKMFEECHGGKLDYDKLNKNYTYSFVMQHTENRNISVVNVNHIILVEARDRKTFDFVDLSEFVNMEYNGYHIVENYVVTNLNDYIVQLSNFTSSDHGRFNYKGFTVKKDGKRYNYINSEFEMVKSLKVNSNNPLFNYCSLRKQNKLSVFLYYFYEYNNQFARYNTVVDIFMKELYDTYVKVNIKKELDKKDVPFQLKPLVYELHGIYLEHKAKINLSKVNDYINSLEPDRLTFILKYYL